MATCTYQEEPPWLDYPTVRHAKRWPSLDLVSSASPFKSEDYVVITKFCCQQDSNWAQRSSAKGRGRDLWCAITHPLCFAFTQNGI